MGKDLTTTASDSHKKLVKKALPLAIDVLTETMELDPYVENEDGVLEFNGRINGQRLRAALGTVQIVERLGDQELRRQAGGHLKKILDAMKAERPDLAKVIDGKAIEP